MQVKTCFRCRAEHPVNFFLRKEKNRDGLDTYCSSCRKALKAEWYARNKEKADAYDRAYYKSHSEFRVKRSAYAAQYEKANRHLPDYKGKKNSREAKRRSLKLCATPAWLTPSQMAEIEQSYWLAQDLKAVSGADYHVDHIVPLQGHSVCGLHVPWNLQVLPSDINLSKSNKV